MLEFVRNVMNHLIQKLNIEKFAINVLALHIGEQMKKLCKTPISLKTNYN